MLATIPLSARLRGGEGRGEVGGGAAPVASEGHLTLPRRSLSSGRALRGPVGRGPLPLPRDAAERGKWR
jgi:hypothetical protein